MSYRPEPDQESEFPRLFAFKRKVVAYMAEHPVAFWGTLWMIYVFVTVPILMLNGLEGFSSPRGIGILAIAGLGWIYPFVLWIKGNRPRRL